MFRLFKHYNVSAPYDGICCASGTEHMKLDPIAVAGQLRVAELHTRMVQRGLGFAGSLNIILVLGVFLSLLTSPDVLRVRRDTAIKWKPHLDEMEGYRLLEQRSLSNAVGAHLSILCSSQK